MARRPGRMMMPLLSGHGINSHTPLAAGDPPHAALRRKEDNAIGCGKGDERWWRQQGVSLDVARNKKWKTKVRCLPMSDHEHERGVTETIFYCLWAPWPWATICHHGWAVIGEWL